MNEGLDAGKPAWGRLLIYISLTALATIAAYLWLPARLTYRLRTTYTISNPGPATALYLGTLLPRSGPYQTVAAPTIDWAGTAVFTTGTATDQLRLTNHLPANSRAQAAITYDATIHHTHAGWEAPVYPWQQAPEPFIESDHPQLRQAALAMIRGASRADAERLFNFTNSHLVWTCQECQCNEVSALTAYEIRLTNCAGHANLLTALCRAAGIPAQRMSGLLLPDTLPYAPAQTAVNAHAAESHAWVEFYADGVWYMADPSRFHLPLPGCPFCSNNGRYLSFGEVKQEANEYQALLAWAGGQAAVTQQQFGGLKFVAASENGQILVTTQTSVRKLWDGRYAAMLTVWLFCTLFFYWQQRRRFIAMS